MIRTIAIVTLAACSSLAGAAPKSQAPAAPSASTQWTLVGQDVNNTKYYIDEASIKRGDDKILTGWLMADWAEPEKTRSGIVYRSRVEQRHFNCESAESTTVHQQLHPGNMMEGKPVLSAKSPVDFIPAQPGSVAESMLNHVCGGQQLIAVTGK